MAHRNKSATLALTQIGCDAIVSPHESARILDLRCSDSRSSGCHSAWAGDWRCCRGFWHGSHHPFSLDKTISGTGGKWPVPSSGKRTPAQTEMVGGQAVVEPRSPACHTLWV